MKKFIALLLALVMVLSLVACGAEDSAPETAPEATNAPAVDAAPADTTAAELEYVELDWYTVTRSKDTDLIQAALDEYFLEKLNCKVNVHWYDDAGFNEAVPTKVMSGEAVDMFFMGNSMPYATYADMGALYPIDTLWDEYGPNVKGLFGEDVWNSLTRDDGHIYCVPTLKDNAYIIGYIYNENLANDLGLDMDNLGWMNFSQSEELLMDARAKRDAMYPEYADMPLCNNLATLNPYMFQLENLSGGNLAVCNIPGLEVEPSAGTDTVYSFFETDAFREYCLMYQRMVENGIVAYDYSVFERNVRYEYSTLLSASWGNTYIAPNIYGDEFNSKLVVFDSTWTDTSNYVSAATCIGVNCKDPERAMMVIDLLNSDPELATLLRFGVEGEHWEKDADGKITLCNRNADPQNYGWLMWYGPNYGNVTIVNGPESHVGPDRVTLTRMAEYVNDAILAPHMGFTVDTSTFSNELAACNNVIAEYNYLINGQVESPEAVNAAVDELIAKLQANGIDKIVAEVQSQLDAWLASK